MAKKSKVSDSSTAEQKFDATKNADFFNSIETGNLYDENKDKFDQLEFMDTECYPLNAILSGDLFNGFPLNRITMFAGAQAVGKTFFLVRSFAKRCNDEGRFLYYIDTENAIDDAFLLSFGLKKGMFKVLKCSTVEEVREQASIIVAKVEEFAKKNPGVPVPKVAMVLDSQGNLTTKKSIEKTAEGNAAKDMTKQVELKRLYAELTTRMGIFGIPFVLTNHIYANIGGYGDPTTIAGGSGALYNSSIILQLSKAKVSEGEKEDRVRLGSIITMKAVKSRFVREQSEIKLYLAYDTGLNRYYGLHILAEKAGLLEEFNKSHEDLGVVKPVGLGQGTKYVLKDPNVDPSKWVICNNKTLHTKEGIGTILNPINEWVKLNFKMVNNDAMYLLDDDKKNEELLSDIEGDE